MSAEWDVYRDENGAPVVLTAEQSRAVWHAISVWRQVCHAEGSGQSFGEHDIGKSRLLGRMLLDGRPPLDEKPPFWFGAPGYHLVEPDLPHSYLGTGPIPVIVKPDGTAVVDVAAMRVASGGGSGTTKET